MKKKIIAVLSVLVLTALDQLSKLWVLRDLKPVGEKPFLPGVLRLLYVENTGAAFGSFKGATTALSVLTGVVIVAGIVALLLGKIKKPFYQVCAVLIIAGGAGNWIDRVARHFVVDFLDVQFMNFAVFNVADIYVTVGAFALIIYLFWDMVQDSRSKKDVAQQ